MAEPRRLPAVKPVAFGRVAVLTAMPLLLATVARAADELPCRGPDGVLTAAVALLTSGEQVLINGRLPTSDPRSRLICPGDVIMVGDDRLAGVRLLGADTDIRLDENSESRFYPPPEPGGGLVDLVRGGLYFLSEVRRKLTIRTPYASAGVEGTEVLMRVRPPGAGAAPVADIIVLEGRVSVSGGTGNPAAFPATVLETGERLKVAAGGALSRTETSAAEGYAALRRIAVGELSWTLFYPDILVADEAADFPRLREAARLLAAGQVDEAEPILAAVPEVGMEAGLRDALRAVVAVGRKDVAEAKSLAEQAVSRAPRSATAQLALSYARQAALDLDGAFTAAEQAAMLAPGSPLAQARKAEIHLMRGETRQARRAADAAVAQGGGPLADIVQGYADLAAARARSAETAFRRALIRESRNPLAFLGLGLALIRQGDLAAGRAEIETAVVHDPSSSLLRSYLGKAYFEERRDEPAGKQLEIAKVLDPGDPTPWFYDAIRKQLENRPIDALRDLERSIELNDNRATFRSRLLLDEDAATRTVSLGRIYNDLGFRQLGINEAMDALIRNPFNSAAHRFLADLYVGQPRLEVARVSELLQAQLLQPVGLNPIQPSLAFADLNIVETSGPSRSSFQEFNPLFLSNGVRADATGIMGTDETFGEEIAVTALAGRTSLSVGQFHYETNGFRRNFDLEHDITSIMSQIDFNDAFSIQAEFRRRDTLQGDRGLRFDPDNFDSTLMDNTEDSIYRFGGRLSLAPNQVGLVSAIYTDREDQVDRTRTTQSRTNVGQLEAQYLVDVRPLQFTVGAGRSVADRRVLRESTTRTLRDELEATATETYGVVEVELTPDLMISGRLGYTDVDLGLGEGMGGATPGIGVVWDPHRAVRMRAVASRSIKRPFVANQTLQPTQLAGFNERVDDPDGTRAQQLGAAVDIKATKELSIGAEVTLRQLTREIVGQLGEGEQTFFLNDQQDDRIAAYLYYTLDQFTALSLEIVGERYEADKRAEQRGNPDVLRVSTLTAPLGIRYFDPRGWFATARAAFVSQDVDGFDDEFRRVSQNSQDIIVDLSAGWRLPDRRGLIAMEAANLLDRHLHVQDEGFRTSREEVSPRFLPARTFLVRVNLHF